MTNGRVARARSPHAVRKYGLVLRTSHVAWSVCLSTRTSCEKTDGPIEIPLGADSHGPKKPDSRLGCSDAACFQITLGTCNQVFVSS